MTTIIPEGEGLKKAVQWISEERKSPGAPGIGKLIETAGMKFNLSPKDAQCLLQLLVEADKDT
ncbi:MAG: hypothetical protein HKM93_16175 [Desulfobacteraceae bacterium]|nr:hypothetical protein [Desulfobacteraceae bacterium]